MIICHDVLEGIELDGGLKVRPPELGLGPPAPVLELGGVLLAEGPFEEPVLGEVALVAIGPGERQLICKKKL